MEKSSTLIMLAIIIAVALPFVLYSLFNRARTKKVQRRFIAFTEKANLRISSKELLNNGNIIALDPDNGKLVYFNAKETNAEPHIIDLLNVQKCRVVTTDGSKKSRAGKESHPNKLELVITLNGSSPGEIALEFYNRTGLMPHQDDYALVQKWANTLNSCQASIKTA